MNIFTPLIAAILPFIVWPLELFLPYPAVIEELAKAVVIFLFNKKTPIYRPYATAFAVGSLFAISESVLYLFNIASVGTLSTLLTRLALTVPLHVGTSLVFSLNAFKGRARMFTGLAIAIALHYVFNALVGSY